MLSNKAKSKVTGVSFGVNNSINNIGEWVSVENYYAATNGKSLIITDKNIKHSSLNTYSTERIKSMVDALILNNYGEITMSEFYLSFNEVFKLKDFLDNKDIVVLKYNKVTQSLIVLSEGDMIEFAIDSHKLNQFKNKSCYTIVDAVELRKLLDVFITLDSESSHVLMGIQYKDAPLLIESESLKSCLSTIKYN